MDEESSINVCPLRIILENSDESGILREGDIKDITDKKRVYSFPIPIPVGLAVDISDIGTHSFTHFNFSDINNEIYIEKLVNIFYLIGSVYESRLIKPKLKKFIEKNDFSNYNHIERVYFQLLKSPNISSYMENDNLFDQQYLFSYFCLTLLSNSVNKIAPVVVKSYTALIVEFQKFSDNLTFKENFENINPDFFENNHFKSDILYNFIKKIETKHSHLIQKFNEMSSLNNYFLEELCLLDINNTEFIESFEPAIANDLLEFIGVLDKLKEAIFDEVFIFDDDFIIDEEKVFKSLSDNTKQAVAPFINKPVFKTITQHCLYPLPYEEHMIFVEKANLKDGLHDIFEDKEIEKYITRFFKDKEIKRSHKKILKGNRYPSEHAAYRNHSNLNILSYLQPLSVDAQILERIKGLKNSYPNFNEIIDYLEICLKMNIRKDNALRFKPILILGNNGLGKSAFINEINNIFNINANTINIGNLTTPAEISGSTSLWSSGQPGFLSKTVIRNKCYNPIIVLEEVDKVITSHHNGRIMAPLYDLLEHRSASDFYENFFSVSFDFSYVNYIATANTLENIDKGIINRFRVFTVNNPKEEDLLAVVNSIYSQLKKDSLFDLVEIDALGLRAISNAFIHNEIRNVRKISKFIEDLLMEAALANDSDEVFVIDYLDDGYTAHSKTIH